MVIVQSATIWSEFERMRKQLGQSISFIFKFCLLLVEKACQKKKKERKKKKKTYTIGSTLYFCRQNNILEEQKRVRKENVQIKRMLKFIYF